MTVVELSCPGKTADPSESCTVGPSTSLAGNDISRLSPEGAVRTSGVPWSLRIVIKPSLKAIAPPVRYSAHWQQAPQLGPDLCAENVQRKALPRPQHLNCCHSLRSRKQVRQTLLSARSTLQPRKTDFRCFALSYLSRFVTQNLW